MISALLAPLATCLSELKYHGTGTTGMPASKAICGLMGNGPGTPGTNRANGRTCDKIISVFIFTCACKYLLGPLLVLPMWWHGAWAAPRL